MYICIHEAGGAMAEEAHLAQLRGCFVSALFCESDGLRKTKQHCSLTNDKSTTCLIGKQHSMKHHMIDSIYRTPLLYGSHSVSRNISNK